MREDKINRNKCEKSLELHDLIEGNKSAEWMQFENKIRNFKHSCLDNFPISVLLCITL